MISTFFLSSTLRRSATPPRSSIPIYRRVEQILIAILLCTFSLAITTIPILAQESNTLPVVADFEGGIPAGFGPYNDAFDGSGSATTVSTDVATEALPVVPGNSANTVASISYDIVTSGSWGGGPGYGGVNHTFSAAQDWSSYDGLALWLKGGNSGLTFQVEISDNGPDAIGAERFDYEFVDDFVGWNYFAIPFADFTRAIDFQPPSAPDDGLTLTQVYGYAIVLAPGAGSLSLDQITLFNTPVSLADFDEGLPGGFAPYNDAFDGSGSATTVTQESATTELPTLPAKADNVGVLVTYDIVTSGSWGGGPGYGGVNHTFASPMDWSDRNGISLWFKGSNSGLTFQVEISDNGPDAIGAERFDYEFVDDSTDWKRFQIPFSAFTRAVDFQPPGAPDDGFTLTQVFGYSIVLAPGAGSFHMDEVALFGAPIELKVGFESADASVTEGESATINVVLNQASEEMVQVDYDTEAGTALPGSDYVDVTNTLNFAPGETVKTITIETLDDLEQEGDESLTVNLNGPVNAIMGSISDLTLTIKDNEETTPGNVDLVEDFESGLSEGSDGDGIPVGWFTAQSADTTISFMTNDAPPEPVPGKAEPNNVLQMDFDVAAWGVIIHNFTNEAADTWTNQDWGQYEGIGFWLYGQNSNVDFFIDLLDNRGAGSTTDDAERYTITFKDDFSGWKYLEFPFASFTRKDVGNAAPNDGLTLTEMHGWAIGTLATDGVTTFYMDDLGLVVREDVVEGFETPLAAGADENGVLIGWFTAQDAGSTVSFATTDSPPAAVPGIDAPNSVLSMEFDVTGFGVVIHNFENETVDTWISQDWLSYQGMAFWLYGQNSGTSLFIDIIDNRTAGSTGDDAERYTITLQDDFSGWQYFEVPFADFTRKDIGNGAPNDGLTLSEVYGWAFGTLTTPGATTYYMDNVTLYGNSGADRPLEVAFGTNAFTVNEDEMAEILVTLSKPAEDEVQVSYATSDRSNRTATEEDSATADRDYLATSGVLTFAPGETETSFMVEILDDAKDEVNETIILNLSDPVNADLGFVDESTISIIDNDPFDPALVDDFELFPYQFDVTGDENSEVTIGISEIASGDTMALPGQGLYEKVMDVTFDSTQGEASLHNNFPQATDWSGYDGISFWYKGSNTGQTHTLQLLDNQVADPGPGGWTLTWSDEFDGPAGMPANPDTWTYETGGWGWGNAEFQYYTDSTDNAAMDGNGNLVITTREIDAATTDLECWYGPCTHTSARLISENKMELAYGRVESRLLVPQGTGIWPAFWMLGADFREVGWPQTGEIDIMEFVGRIPQEIFGTIHGPGYSGGASFGGIYDLGEDVFNDYHTFAVEWQPGQINWFFDGIQYHSAVPADVEPNEWVFEHPFFMILNTAVGGNFGGDLGPDLVFPQEYKVDYVRVYQAPDTAERFETTFVDDFQGWQQITLPFSAFSRSANQPAGAPDDGLTLSEMHGYGFALAPNSSGAFSVDQVRLMTPPVVCRDAITVMNNADAGEGSLRDALANLCENGTISFDASLAGSTIALTSGPLVVSQPASIDASAVPGLTISGGGTDRVFIVDAGVEATIMGVTITDGYGFDLAGGILNNGTLTLSMSTVMNNLVDATANDFWKGGGGIYNGENSTLNLLDSTVKDNSTVLVDGAGIYGFFGSTINIMGSTISGNVAGNVGGGLRTLGNGEISNSTLSGNTSVWHGGALFHTDGVMAIVHSTIVENIAPADTSGGLFVGTFGESAPDLTLTNSIVANNDGAQCFIGFFGPGVPELFSGGGNLASDATCNPTGPGDLVDTDPLVGLLADNGGKTATHALMDDSPAIDAANQDACLTVDQRNEARPMGNGCDIGAFEAEVTAVEPFATCGGYNVFKIKAGVYEAPDFAGNLVVGTYRDDWLTGTHGPDLILGLGGHDDIFGWRGDDVICGGYGFDFINGNEGDDTIFGDDRADRLVGGPGNDTLYGGGGWDDLLGGLDDDILYGGPGYDVLLGDRGEDELFGGDGPDDLFGNQGDDDLNGGQGNDSCQGGSGNDTLTECEEVSAATLQPEANDMTDMDVEAALRSNDGPNGEHVIEQRILDLYLPMLIGN
ncbi:MAG: carbohydrate binding domain-containing protein [Chloroflexota bacterium]